MDRLGAYRKSRSRIPHRHADGLSESEVVEHIQAFVEQGYRYVRCQLGGYGGKSRSHPSPEGALAGVYFDPMAYARSIPHLFATVRNRFGNDLEVLHDIHERLVLSPKMYKVKLRGTAPPSSADGTG